MLWYKLKFPTLKIYFYYKKEYDFTASKVNYDKINNHYSSYTQVLSGI